jgi:hypothetical protein
MLQPNFVTAELKSDAVDEMSSLLLKDALELLPLLREDGSLVHEGEPDVIEATSDVIEETSDVLLKDSLALLDVGDGSMAHEGKPAFNEAEARRAEIDESLIEAIHMMTRIAILNGTSGTNVTNGTNVTMTTAECDGFGQPACWFHAVTGWIPAVVGWADATSTAASGWANKTSTAVSEDPNYWLFAPTTARIFCVILVLGVIFCCVQVGLKKDQRWFLLPGLFVALVVAIVCITMWNKDLHAGPHESSSISSNLAEVVGPDTI